MSSDEIDASDRDADVLLEEIVDKAGASIGAFSLERTMLLSYSYIVTSILGATIYGYISVFTRGNSLLASALGFITAGNERTMPRLDAEDKMTIITVSYILVLIVGVILSSILYLGRDSIISQTLLNSTHRSTVLIFAVSLFPTYVVYNSSSVLRSFRRIRLSMLLSKIGIPLCITIGTILPILITENPTVSYIWLSYTILISILAIISIFVLNLATDISTKPTLKNTEVIRDYIGYLSSTIFVNILGVLNRQSVFVVMAILLSPVAAGLFSLSLIIGQICRWPLNGVNQIFPAIATSVYEADQKEKLRDLYKRTSLLATFVASPILILIITYYTEILLFFSEQYVSAAIILPIVIVGQYLATIVGSVGLMLLMTDNEKPTMLLHFVHAAVILPAIILLTIEYGVLGLGVAYFFSLAFNNITELMLLYHLEKLSPFTIRHLYVSIFGGVTLSVTFGINMILPLLISIPICVSVTAIYLYLTYQIILDDAERSALMSFT